jgi:hypothetical protein
MGLMNRPTDQDPDHAPQQLEDARLDAPRLAAALAGDREAVREAMVQLEREPEAPATPGAPPGALIGAPSGALIGARLPMLLARRATESEPPLEIPDRLRALRARTAARWMAIERMLAELGRRLGAAEVAWAPIKGADLAATVYPEPTDRPMTDVDLLVPEACYRRARRALETAGWRSAVPGPRFDRFIEDEGTAWTAVRDADPVPVELHFRLWGFVPAGLGDALLDRSAPEPSLGPTGRRLRPVDRFLLAAIHPWLHLPPRSLANWWEVRLLAEPGSRQWDGQRDESEGAPGGLLDEIVDSACRWGLQLPVTLSAVQVTRLWDDARCSRLAETLERTLRTGERLAVRRFLDAAPARAGTPDDVSIERLAAARILARRPSRSGLRPLLRRVWAHPGVVERLTPDAWSWPRRRVVHVLQCLGMAPAPRGDWWRAPTHGHRAR